MPSSGGGPWTVEGDGRAERPRLSEAGGRRLSILVINWQDRRNPYAGGAEVHLHEIFGRLAAAGHRVRLLASGWEGAPDRERLDGMEVHRAGSRHGFPLAVRRAYRDRFAGERFDVVVEDVNKLPLYTPLWIRAPVVVLVPHLFGTTAFREASPPVAAVVWAAERLMPLLYRGVPVQAISESTARDLERRGFEGGRIEVIYPGVDHDAFRRDPAVPRFERPTAAYVGRLKRYKGLDVVLRAVELLRERGTALRLLVAGKGDDASRLRRLARRSGLGERVEFLGHVSESRKVELLRRAWVNIYPSPKEGWGITNVEAAACGTPSVASDSPGLRESVAEGVSGFLVPHDDPVAWADRLAELCGDEELRDRLGRGALRHAARFSWDRAAAETEASLRRAAATPPRPAGSGRATPPGTERG